MNLIFNENFGVICATLLGPILAVQVQKFLERGRVKKDRQLAIFRTLMATRAVDVSPAHVEALNAVPVEFYGKGGKLRAINDAWKIYFDHHTVQGPPSEVWVQTKRTLFVDLLYLMSEYLGYSFSKAQLKSDIYHPQAHLDFETENALIRERTIALLKGEISLPMSVKEFPETEPSPEIRELLRLLTQQRRQ